MNCLFQKTNLKFWRLLKSILTSVWQHFFVLVYGLHVYPVCPIVDLYRVPFIVVLVSVGWNIFCYWFKWPVITTVCSTAKTNKIDKLSFVKFASSQLDVINYTVPFMFMTVMFLCSLRKYNLAFSQHMHCLFNSLRLITTTITITIAITTTTITTFCLISLFFPEITVG